jgi:exopolyphosphatase/guanosine-5'-triphosphate,3'-diphosphate pyrophosphatase
MHTFAAIDIGSNSCRLKIGRVVQHRLRIVHEDREVTRLGASVFDTGIVSPESMAATLRTLKRFYKAVQMHGTDKVRCVATSAMRDARNSRAFQAWVRDETGWDVEIISGLEEGRLIHRGVVENEPGAGGRCVLVDIGGGSCEITLSEHKRILETISLPLGAVRLTQEFLRSEVPGKDEVHRELRRASRRIHPERVRLVIGTSGTAAATFDAGRVLGKGRGAKDLVPTQTVRRLTAKFTKMTTAQRSAVPGIGPKRAEIIVAGAHVLAEVLEVFGLPGFRYSPMGLRDGILAQMLAEQDPRTSAHRQFEQDRRRAVEEACRKYGIDPRQAEPVREHAAQMFHDLAAVHELPQEYQTWLESAAMLRDIGKFLNHQGYHRHAQYIIANSELYGFTPQQRVVTSAIARYLGKSRPEPQGRTMRQVPPEEYEHVRRAVVLLRLAVALNQDRASDVLKVRVRVYPKRVLMELLPGRTGAELELWSLRKEAAYFREVFGRELFVALA